MIHEKIFPNYFGGDGAVVDGGDYIEEEGIAYPEGQSLSAMCRIAVMDARIHARDSTQSRLRRSLLQSRRSLLRQDFARIHLKRNQKHGSSSRRAGRIFILT